MLALYGSAAYLLVVVKCMLKISFKSFVPKQKTCPFSSIMHNGSSQSLFTFSFLIQQNFMNWIQQIAPSSKISSYICYVQCTYYEKRTFLHFARPVGTFLVCRRKLSELSSKVQIVWEGLKIWKNLPRIFEMTYCVRSKQSGRFFQIFIRISELYLRMCVVRSRMKFFLKSFCYFHASLLFHEIYNIFCSISKVQKFVKYNVKSKVKDKY